MTYKKVPGANRFSAETLRRERYESDRLKGMYAVIDDSRPVLQSADLDSTPAQKIVTDGPRRRGRQTEI